MPLSETLDTLPTARQRDWRAFLDRAGWLDMPESFEEAVEGVKDFVDPMLRDDPNIVRWNPSTRSWGKEE